MAISLSIPRLPTVVTDCGVRNGVRVGVLDSVGGRLDFLGEERRPEEILRDERGVSCRAGEAATPLPPVPGRLELLYSDGFGAPPSNVLSNNRAPRSSPPLVLLGESPTSAPVRRFPSVESAR